MTPMAARFQVARWEFLRFVKPNQLVISFVLTLLMGALGYGVARLAGRSDSRVHDVAVIGGAPLGISTRDTVGNIGIMPADVSQLDSLRTALAARTIEGIVVIDGTDSAQLIARRNPVWRGALETHLATARQRVELVRSGLPAERLASILTPVAVSATFFSGSDSRGSRIAAMVASGLVLYGVFTAMAYMLVSVTAEKQLRVTEQVISAISPQTWIDGKILGIAAVSLVNVVVFLGGATLFVAGRSMATGSPFSMGTAEPAALLWITLFALLGFLFWLSAFGAIAATIDDPNTSARGPIMFLPAFFSTVGFMVVRNPDSTFARIAGIVPLTSSAVMPARVALTEVPLWELGLSAALLIGGAALAHLAAGKVFAVAMLMYGKEPGWNEIRRWIRES